jgi:hypothetical protein
MSKFYFDGLVMSNILSFIGTRKSVGQQITVGVYSTLNVNMSKWRTTNKLVLRLERFKISERIGNRVIVSKWENGVWSMPNIQDVHTFKGVETIKNNRPAVWRWIQPKHKLECLFTKKEWLTFSLTDKAKRYCAEINEDIHQWWINYV